MFFRSSFPSFITFTYSSYEKRKLKHIFKNQEFKQKKKKNSPSQAATEQSGAGERRILRGGEGEKGKVVVDWP